MKILASLVLLMSLTVGCHVAPEVLTPIGGVVISTRDLEEVAKSVVFIRSSIVTSDGHEMASASGSGVYLDWRAYGKEVVQNDHDTSTSWQLKFGSVIATARHVVRGFNKFVVRVGDVELDAEVLAVGKLPQEDFALLQCKGMFAEARAAKVSSGPLRRFEPCLAVGFALGLDDVTITQGLIQGNLDELIRISAPIIFGNSGGGVFIHRKGLLVLVGLVVAGYSENGSMVCHMGLAVPIEKVKELYDGVR